MDTNYNKISENTSKEDKENKIPDDNKTDEKIIRAVVTNCSRLNVRQRASLKSNIICVINEGDKVIISPINNVDFDDNWAHVKLKNGIKGFVMGDYIKEV